ncbi:hypothetical protein AMS58_06020 [Pseudoalteromonas porphyrae]|uniref:Uncharacterized protein n=1 Tax=Pseudoalteromonas porphyrae TaxID=187330 RepID=A0A0N0M1N6_9GAMM|nr:hypothetical protein ADS77_00345 [Pseudoalteromonas porphyrae]KPH95736.1 hypothetical protein AMS58_06020 [Pseudoalteromonas porphyrae]
MWQCVFLIFSILGCCFLYLTNKHQGALINTLAVKPWRILGYFFLFVSLLGWLWLFTISNAIFTWVVINMVTLGCAPLLINRSSKAK